VRWLLTFVALALIGYVMIAPTGLVERLPATATASDSVITTAFDNRISDVQVSGSGEVVRLLADDNEGSRHQRFVLALDNGHTLLVAHNIDLAPRLDALRVGDRIEFNGEYEWNPRGGVLHWTHRDPQGKHAPGWLKHHGKTFQ
jgi:hypothetical protein